jgi:hypothetical protein
MITGIAVPANNPCSRTVMNKVPRHMRQRAGAELRRHTARFAAAVCSLLFLAPYGNAAELLTSVHFVNGGAVLSCDYTRSDERFMFTCSDTHAVFALRCASVAWSALSAKREEQQEFVCPVSAERSAFGNALRLRCSEYDAHYFEVMRAAPNPRFLVEGRIPTHHCDSAKVDVE